MVMFAQPDITQPANLHIRGFMFMRYINVRGH